jgi:predicted helicase
LDSIECKVVCSLDEDSFGGGEVVVTDESELRTLLCSKRERQLILVTSYHSVHKIHAALGDTNTNNPSLIVLDEAHNVHTKLLTADTQSACT